MNETIDLLWALAALAAGCASLGAFCVRRCGDKDEANRWLRWAAWLWFAAFLGIRLFHFQA